MITLYTAATPNGHKVSIALEELGLPYLKRWRDAMRARLAVARGIEMPPSRIDLTRDGLVGAQQFAEEARCMVETGQSLKTPQP